VGKRIVLVTCGTLGDFNPYLAVAACLKRRGHEPVIAASAAYRARAQRAGIDLVPIPPDMHVFQTDPEVQRKALHPLTGTEYVVRQILLPSLEECYRRLDAVCADADLIVGHFLAFAAPLVAEKRGLPWLQVYLHPTNLFSVYDPPVLHGMRVLGPAALRAAFGAIRLASSHWMRPVRELRAALGLPPAARHPLLDGWSPYGTLAWFPQILVERQPDWPPRLQVTGYPFAESASAESDGAEGATDLAELEEFVRGRSPVVFTLGSTAVLRPRQFFEVSARAAAELGVSALLVGTSDQRYECLPAQGDQIRVVGYADYSQVFPHASMIVHHGGIGSVSQALLAGKQMLVVPFAWDQPDNARRIQRLGLGLAVPIRRYTPKIVGAALATLLSDEAGRARARQIAMQARHENGAANAAQAIEAFLQSSRRAET
jgi:rhamnosyltransferase subunit B